MDARATIDHRLFVLEVVLKPERDRSVRRRHPWLFAGAVAQVEGEETPGAWARVRSAAGEVLGYGHFSPRSSLRVRLLSFDKDPPPEDWLRERIASALERRCRDPLVGDTDAVRLVNAEGDGLPGLIVDRYADVVVMKMSAVGMHARGDEIAGELRRATGAAVGFERADGTAARREGFPVREGVVWGDGLEPVVWIRERTRRFAVDVRAGQKTGFYLDQRDARDLVQGLASGRRVLDLFAYTGGFAAAAARGGAARVTLVESSAAALELARRNLEANAPGVAFEIAQADAFRWVRRTGPRGGGGEGERYDLLIVDPPPLARNKRDVERASRAYKDVLLHALQLCAPRALVLAFACSHHLGPELVRRIAFAASLDAGRSVTVLRELGAPADHPVSIDHPEGAYLTGLLLRA